MDDSFTYILQLCEVAIIVHNLTFGQKSSYSQYKEKVKE